MNVVFAVDALEYEKVIEYGCEPLKQVAYGKTDISEFSEARTMVLWSSFITGQNKEDEVLGEGNQEMWHIRYPRQETVFNAYDDPLVLDLPGYNYDKDVHDRSRELLKKYFTHEQGKEETLKAYNEEAFAHHRKIKDEFLTALEKDHDLVMGYFSAADVIGHLSYGDNNLMKMIYGDLESIAEKAAEKADKMLIVSDHGMVSVGRFGDHSTYGYWSLNYEKDLGTPKITDFRKLIENW